MADVLISQLNQQFTEKVANKNLNLPAQAPNSGASGFAQVLDNKRNDRLEVLGQMVSEPTSQIKAQAAPEIQINTANLEKNGDGAQSHGQRFFGIFKDLNNDMLSMDSTIEVLSNPDVKLSRRQLLAYQAGIGNMTINAELFSRLAQSVAQNISQLLQTQV